MSARLSGKQLRILHYLATHRVWSTREDMIDATGKKGFSLALGAPTTLIKPGSLLGLGYVEQRDMTPPFAYRITQSGSGIIKGHALPALAATVRSNRQSALRPSPPPTRTNINAPKRIGSSGQRASGKPSLAAFDRTVRELIDDRHPNWPFLCQGSPLECEVAVVGINPATPIPLWPFWSLSYGCDREAWLREFWKRHRGERKPTRKRLNILFDCLRSEPRPLKCLETNLYPYCSASPDQLTPPLRDTRVFDYLLSVIKPKVLVVHGTDPRKHLEEHFDVRLTEGEFTRCVHDGSAYHLYPTKHFRFLAYSEMERIAERIKQHIR